MEDGTLKEKEAKKRKRKKKSVDTTPGDEPAAKVHMFMINIFNYLLYYMQRYIQNFIKYVVRM